MDRRDAHDCEAGVLTCECEMFAVNSGVVVGVSGGNAPSPKYSVILRLVIFIGLLG